MHRHLRSKPLRRCVVVAGLLLANTQQARAIDVVPGGYVIAPPGTLVGQIYFNYATSNELHNDLAGRVRNSKLRNESTVTRWIYYDESAGVPYMFNILAGAAKSSTLEVGGTNMKTHNGLVDTTLNVAFWPVKPSNPELGTTVGIAAYLDVPTGAYDDDRASTGSHTWKFTPQIGVVQGLGGGLYLEGAADVTYESDNDTRDATLSRDPSYHLQTTLRQTLPARSMVAIGYAKKLGGKSYREDRYTGSKIESDQVRLYASTYLTKTLQIYGAYKKDFNTEGGFASSTFQIRLSKLF